MSFRTSIMGEGESGDPDVPRIQTTSDPSVTAKKRKPGQVSMIGRNVIHGKSAARHWAEDTIAQKLISSEPHCAIKRLHSGDRSTFDSMP
jgi:hypothetical protein